MEVTDLTILVVGCGIIQPGVVPKDSLRRWLVEECGSAAEQYST